jgi:hypothetical protein
MAGVVEWRRMGGRHVGTTYDGALTPVEYSFATVQDDPHGHYSRLATQRPGWEGVGFLHCVSDDGQRITAVVEDLEYFDLLIGTRFRSISGAVDIPSDKIGAVFMGWPQEWAKSS